MRTKSLGLSSSGAPRGWLLSQRWPMMANRTSHFSTSRSSRSTKSTPNGILSTSLKIFCLPKSRYETIVYAPDDHAAVTPPIAQENSPWECVDSALAPPARLRAALRRRRLTRGSPSSIASAIAVRSSSTSCSHRVSRNSIALRELRGWRSGGSSSGVGIVPRSTKTGMTRTCSFLSAVAISSRSKSFGSSSHLIPGRGC